MKPETPRRLSPRLRTWLIRCAAGFLLYSLAGFFLLPPILKWQLCKRLPELTKRQAVVQQVRANPWTLSLTVRGLALNEPDGRPFASWDELYVNFQASSLFRWAWTFSEIRLVKPFGEVIAFKDGLLNVANLLTAPTNAPPKPTGPAAIPRINIFRFEVTNGFAALEDRTRRTVFRTEYRPINLRLSDFTTRPDSDTPYSFHAESDAGRSVSWAGDVTVQPLRSSGHLEVTGVQLPRYQPYLEDFTRAIVTNGLADVQLDYRLAADTNGFQFVVTNAALQVAQVQVLDPDTGEIVAALRDLDVKQAGFNFRENVLRLGAVKVTEAALLARLKRDARLNLLDLLTLPPTVTNVPSPAAAAAPHPALVVAVDDFTVERAAVSFEDLTLRTPFKTELKPIEVNLKGFTTRPEADGSYSFRVASEAEETVAGAGSFSINPLRSSGEVKLSAGEVKKYLPYAAAFFRGKVIAGKLEVRAPYRVALEAGQLRAGVTNLDLKLTALELQMPETSERVTHIKELAFERVEASLEDRRGRVGLFHADGGSVLVRRQRDGSINLLGLLAISETNAAPAGSPGTNASAFALGGWTLNLEELRLDNYTLKLEDHLPPKPATFLLDQVALNLKGASSVLNTPIAVNASFRLNESATVAAHGTAKVAPPAADLAVAVTNLDLRTAQPYVEQFVALGIVSGALNAAGQVSFQTNDPAAPLLTFVGGASLTNLVTTDQVAFKEFVRCEALIVNGIDAAFAPTRLKLEEVRLVRPKASLLIGADRRPNFSQVLRQDAAATNGSAASASQPGATTSAPAEMVPIQLGTLTLDRAAFAFTDESVQPPVTVGIEELSGTIKQLSSAQTTPAEVDLSGRLDAQSPFAVAGRLNPFPATRLVDLTITNANTQLTPLTGYLEKYGGYPLRKGRLSTRLRYHVEGTTLQAENKIQVDLLTLGPANNSPDATKLPLKLGIALLKDSDGRIELDVPVKGKLDDPQFSLGPLVLKVVVNLILKAAASPFKLLGALVGGGGDELSFVAFVPGTTNLVEGEVEKLGKLAAALLKRPALNLELEGGVDPAFDRTALAREKLANQLKASRLQELAAKGRAPESADTFQLEPEERERLLRAAFVERFGTNIAGVIQTNLARLTATNQPAAATPKPKRGLLQSLTGVFGGAGNGASKTEKQLPRADREALGLATPEIMEELLVELIPVSEAEFRSLVTARARWVQDWLVQTGQVAADRLFLVAPKTVGASYQGESRVNLSVN
jgi:hypothetical protein